MKLTRDEKENSKVALYFSVLQRADKYKMRLHTSD